MKEKNNKIEKENQFGVVLEDINSKLNLVLESFGILDKKIDQVGNEIKEELSEFKIETKNNFKSFRQEMDEFKTETNENFEKTFEFQVRAEENFKVTLEYLMRLDDEIQTLKAQFKDRPNLAALFEKRMKNLEKDLAICKKALALR